MREPIQSDRAAQMRARVASSKPVPTSNLTGLAPLRSSHTKAPNVPAAFLLAFDDDRCVRPRALVVAGLRLISFSTTPTTKASASWKRLTFMRPCSRIGERPCL